MPSPEPGPLVVHTSGSVLVATDALLAHLPLLTRIADDTEADGHRLALLALDAPPGPLRIALGRCERGAYATADSARRLHAALVAAEAGYATAERITTRFQDIASDWLAALVGRAAVVALPPIMLGGWLGWQLLPGDDAGKKAAVQQWLLQHPELITSPEFSALVGRVVTGADDAVLGAVGLPQPLGLILGENGLGLLGVDTSAAVLVAAGTLSGGRLLHETPVRVERVAQTTSDAAPSGAAERLARVPDDRQVRIERYSAPGCDDRFVVYVAPTQTFSPLAEGEPWDLTSNIAGVGGLPAGSIRATELAMADAGITADSEVVLVGFSQGGLVADAIAGSGRWNTTGLETYGDPGGGIELPEGIHGVAVRHSDDFVVATGGPQQPTDRVIVERRAFPEGAPLPTDRPAPAHQRAAYVVTAGMLDDARSPQLRAELDALDSFTHDYARREGAEITTFSYRAERLAVPQSEGVDAGRFSASASAAGR